ncbi:MAG: hypothetical protein Mars2KO_39290 [Maribacter sp.]|uniref:hypothetical protein n=1 Tax=Maribacter sp. 2307UL18-2 TaxID=3386274 RepID=UPI0039BC2914
MAPNKFEKHIKKELENREIQPSSDAWLKLSDRLDDTSAEQPRKKGYLWYAVAACFIGLIVLSTIFFKGTAPVSEPAIQVVEDATKSGEEVEDFSKDTTPHPPVEVVINEEAPKQKVERKPTIEKKEILETENANTQLADSSEKVEVPLSDPSEEIIKTKLMEVLAQVDALEQNQEQITDAEVDSLLRKAQEELLTGPLFRNDQSVDAMALLSEVENELDKSFRDQIFESLKSGFLKVRTAVADRNN